MLTTSTFKVCVSQYVEQTAEIEVAAADHTAAIEKVHELFRAGAADPDWRDGCHATPAQISSVVNRAGEPVWSRFCSPPLDDKTATAKPMIIMLHDTPLKSILTNAIDLSMAIGLMGIGRLLDSSPMAWTGFLLFALIFIARAGHAASRVSKTPQQAADYLRDRFGVTATPEKEAAP